MEYTKKFNETQKQAIVYAKPEVVKLTADDKKLIASEYEKDYGANRPKWTKEYVNKTSAMVDLGDYVWRFEKPRIEKTFFNSWGHAGHYADHFQCAEAWKNTDKEQYFIDENMKGSHILDAIELLASDIDVVIWKSCGKPKSRLSTINRYDEHDYTPMASMRRSQIQDAMRNGDARFLNPVEKDKLLAVMLGEKVKFEKRLRSYLKRYGTSKLSFDSYWADR